jgi:hypothetical protein
LVFTGLRLSYNRVIKKYPNVVISKFGGRKFSLRDVHGIFGRPQAIWLRENKAEELFAFLA